MVHFFRVRDPDGKAVQACTGIRLIAADGTVVYARTLEFALDLESEILAVPRGYARTGTPPDRRQRDEVDFEVWLPSFVHCVFIRCRTEICGNSTGLFSSNLVDLCDFDNLGLETLHEGDDLSLFVLRHFELCQRRRRMTEKRIPIALADAHAAMADPHLSPAVVHWPAGARAQEIDQQLLFAFDAIYSAMSPEAAELRICAKARQQVVCYGSDRVVTSEALV